MKPLPGEFRLPSGPLGAFRRPGPRGMVDRWVADRASLCSQPVDPDCLDRKRPVGEGVGREGSCPLPTN